MSLRYIPKLFSLCLNSNYSVTMRFTSFQKWKKLLFPVPSTLQKQNTEKTNMPTHSANRAPLKVVAFNS